MTYEKNNQVIENSVTVTITGNGVGAYGAFLQGYMEEAWRANPSLFTGGLLAKATVLSAFPDLLTVTIAVQSGDSGRIGAAAFKALGSVAIGAAAAAVAPVGLVGMAVVAVAGFGGGVAGGMIWNSATSDVPDPAAVRPTVPQWVYNPFVDPLDGGISDFDPNSLTSIQDEYAEGELTLRFIPPTDPLVLDLNGNGIIDTVGLGAGVRFDHNGSGVKQLTGWAGPSDGFLVMDRNGNGVIDNGLELFGNNTPLLDANGNVVGNAPTGFAALAQQDSNGDGQVNSLDANWASLRVWQDSNQDGVSQAGELFSMTALGITDLKVASAAYFDFFFSSTSNLITSTGSFTRNGVTMQMGDVSGRVAAQQRGTHRPTPCGWNLVLDPTTRVFADSIAATPQAAVLPAMMGSGSVRDLREAANDAVFEVRRAG